MGNDIARVDLEGGVGMILNLDMNDPPGFGFDGTLMDGSFLLLSEVGGGNEVAIYLIRKVKKEAS